MCTYLHLTPLATRLNLGARQTNRVDCGLRYLRNWRLRAGLAHIGAVTVVIAVVAGAAGAGKPAAAVVMIVRAWRGRGIVLLLLLLLLFR